MYKVRYLSDDCKIEHVEYCKSYLEALERFLFFVHCACELGVHIRCVNIILRNKTIQFYQNR